MSVEQRLSDLATAQYGLFSRRQVLDLGGDDELIRRRLRQGRWDRALPGVYELPGHHRTHLRDLWIAHLAMGPRSTVSHQSAAGLHYFDGFPRDRIVLTVPHSGQQRVSGAFAHQISDLTESDRTTILGLPTTRIARTLVDLAAVCSTARLGAALDDALAAKRTSCTTVGQVLRSVARPGKPGVHLLARLLDDRGPGYVPPASELERVFFAVLHRAGLPRPRRQHPLPGTGPLEGLVDAAYVEAKVIIEVDGRRWHAQAQQMAKDRARDQQAARAGWLTLRFTYEQVTEFPDEVVRVVTETLRSRPAPLSTQ